MSRFALLAISVAVILSPPSPVTAQADAPRVYLSYLKVDFTDLETVMEGYQEVEVPVLNALLDEGLLLGYAMTTHNTGGEYNLRMALHAPNWDALGDFWDAYFARMPEDHVARVMSMIRGHTDEIWIVGEMASVEGADPATFLYESAWDVAFDRLQEWTADFERYTKPALRQAMDEGLITGWVRLDHDTGPWNVKYVYWLTEWDAYDDLSALLAESREAMDLERLRAARAHQDNVWQMVPPTANN